MYKSAKQEKYKYLVNATKEKRLEGRDETLEESTVSKETQHA